MPAGRHRPSGVARSDPDPGGLRHLPAGSGGGGSSLMDTLTRSDTSIRASQQPESSKLSGFWLLSKPDSKGSECVLGTRKDVAS
jgi:hypothetical protein